MAGYKTYRVPSFDASKEDLVFCDVDQRDAPGTMHYSFAVAANSDPKKRREVQWLEIRPFSNSDYSSKHEEALKRIQSKEPYIPGESFFLQRSRGLANPAETVIRLGALEIAANISSGRLSSGAKDPFPHQLALQQEVRRRLLESTSDANGKKGALRVLLADEVGLGKTIEAGLIIRDYMLGAGRVDELRCLYLTSGGLVEDAASKLRDVIEGAVDGQKIVQSERLTAYGNGNISGVRVASLNAARLYVKKKAKSRLPKGVAPNVVIIDECHHCACERGLDGKDPSVYSGKQGMTRSFEMAHQIITGEFWEDSEPPSLVLLMSATPFRSQVQFTNLMRLITHGMKFRDGTVFNAYEKGISEKLLRDVLVSDKNCAMVAWRRQTDPEVKSWSEGGLFPDLQVIRPSIDKVTGPKLKKPGRRYLQIIDSAKNTIRQIAKYHNKKIGGFQFQQLEKKMTSSSIAGACWLFTWMARHHEWDTQEEFRTDNTKAANALRNLIRAISKSLAKLNPATQGEFADVKFPSEGFDEFTRRKVGHPDGKIIEIQKYSRLLREDAAKENLWTLEEQETLDLAELAVQLLELGDAPGGAENAKLAWLNEMLEAYPEDRFLVFTESLQTCEIVDVALGERCVCLRGAMSLVERNRSIRRLSDPEHPARVLIATSAADEGFDLQVANRVVHWDLSSSPATLMQRNGRVARLGQKSEVFSYYLILAGTHEERRDRALKNKFAELGIEDENLRTRVLGALSPEDEERMHMAIENGEDRLIEELLRSAQESNKCMEANLLSLNAKLACKHALSRSDVLSRLDLWKNKLGLPEQVGTIDYDIRQIEWQKPVFSSPMRVVTATARIADFSVDGVAANRGSLAFDPEFLLFGENSGGIGLAGLSPWTKSEERHDHKIRPVRGASVIDELVGNLVRISGADFFVARRGVMPDELSKAVDEACRWVLFCSHPFRELEDGGADRPYLTYYQLCADGFQLGNFAGAEEVFRMISFLEDESKQKAVRELAASFDESDARHGGQLALRWVGDTTSYGRKEDIFSTRVEDEPVCAPIPVALIALI